MIPIEHPAIKKTWVSHDGNVVLYCADCLEILPHLPKVDCVLTDPPYVLNHLHGGGFAAAREFYAGGALDGMDDFDLAKYADVLFQAKYLVAFHSRDLILPYALQAKERGYFYDLHFWHKTNAIPFTNNTFLSDIEYIAVCRLGGGTMGKKLPRNLYSKLYQSSITTGKVHPTEKPIDLMAKYATVLGPRSILDPFMGSGTTGAACVRTGRSFVGIEIDETYFDIAVKRIDAETRQGRLF